MKHLKLFKVFESDAQDDDGFDEDEKMYQYINDLFSDIKSEGVRVFTSNRMPNSYRVIIGEYSDQVEFSYSQIADEVSHVMSYFINDHRMRLNEISIYFSKRPKSAGKSFKLDWNRPVPETLEFLKENKDDKCIFTLSLSFRKGRFPE